MLVPASGLLILASGLLACSGAGDGPISDYTLDLQAVYATGQRPLEDLDLLQFVFHSPDGESSRESIESPGDGTLTLTNLPALDETTLVIEGYRDDALVSRGRTAPLSATTGAVEARVFIAETDAAAQLTAISDGIYLPLVASLGGGRFLIAGGIEGQGDDNLRRYATDSVNVLTLAPPGETLAFEPLGATLPAYEDARGDSITRRVGASFTELRAAGDNQGKFLLIGGSESLPYEDSDTISASASLYDPAADVWEASTSGNAALDMGRSMHIAIENTRGDVIVWGGWGYYQGGTSILGSLELYDRDRGVFSAISERPGIGELDAAGADIGEEGTLLCGGALVDVADVGYVYTAVDVCDRVTLDGDVSSVTSLPEGLAGLAMLTLRDGRVLVTGGANAGAGTELGRDEEGTPIYIAASESAWIYDPAGGGWSPLEDMNVPRAGHRMAGLPDGRVLIVGGGATYSPMLGTSSALACLEIFDPSAGDDADSTTHDFTSVGDCDAESDTGPLYGRAYQPAVAADPDFGVVIVGGLAAETSAQKGVNLFVPAQ